MKINLDAEEISALLVDWAKKKYKTHNVSAGFEVKGNQPHWTVSATLELTMTNDQLTDNGIDTVDFGPRLASIRSRNIEVVNSIEQPDFSPAFDAMVTPLA